MWFGQILTLSYCRSLSHSLSISALFFVLFLPLWGQLCCVTAFAICWQTLLIFFSFYFISFMCCVCVEQKFSVLPCCWTVSISSFSCACSVCIVHFVWCGAAVVISFSFSSFVFWITNFPTIFESLVFPLVFMFERWAAEKGKTFYNVLIFVQIPLKLDNHPWISEIKILIICKTKRPQLQ